MLTQEYLVKNNVKTVDIKISKDAKYATVDVEFLNRPEFHFVVEVNPYFPQSIADEIHENIVIHDRIRKIKKLKNKLNYGYFRRLFKRT